MTHRSRLAVALALYAAGLVFTAPARAADTARLVVTTEPGTSLAEQADLRADTDARLVSRPMPGTQVLTVPTSREAAALDELRADERVESVVPDARAHEAAATPNDSLFSNQWALYNAGRIYNGVQGIAGADVDALDAWDLSTGAGQTVAVVDTGVALTIPTSRTRPSPADTTGSTMTPLPRTSTVTARTSPASSPPSAGTGPASAAWRLTRGCSPCACSTLRAPAG